MESQRNLSVHFANRNSLFVNSAFAVPRGLRASA